MTVGVRPAEGMAPAPGPVGAVVEDLNIVFGCFDDGVDDLG